MRPSDTRPVATGAALTLALAVLLSPAATALADGPTPRLTTGDGRRTMNDAAR